MATKPEKRLKRNRIEKEPTKLAETPMLKRARIRRKDAEIVAGIRDQATILLSCCVVDCPGKPVDEMMVYNKRSICVNHFEELCAARNKKGGGLEITELFDLKPIESEPSKKKMRASEEPKEVLTKPDKPWFIAREKMIEIFKRSPAHHTIKELLAALLESGWVPPTENRDLPATLHDVVNRMVKDHLVVKISRGKYANNG